MAWIVLFLLLWAPSSMAQTARKKKPAAAPASSAAPAPAASAFPITSISIEGNKAYASDRIVAASGLKIGQPAAKKEFDAARDRLIATGAFSSVGYRFTPTSDGKGYAAVFQVDEIQQIFPFKLQGLEGDSKTVAEALKHNEPLFVDKIPGTEEVLKRISHEVEAQLTKEGHPEKVVGKLSAEANGDLVIIFRPSRLASVAEVHFQGNHEIPTVTLRGAIADVAVGSVYTEENFRQLLDTNVRPVYERIGKIRVSFPKLTTAPAQHVDGIIVMVTVDEGPTYKLGEVNIVGPLAGDQKLMKEGSFKTDEVADFGEIKAGIDRMEAMLRKGGFMRVSSKTDRKIDDAKHIVNLNITIEPGEQFKFGKLAIDGLDIETEPQIRKMWAMKSGQPYNADYPYFFLRRIESDGVFENLGKTRTALHIDDESRIVDVTLFFSANGAPPPSVGPARDELERRRKAEEKDKH